MWLSARGKAVLQGRHADVAELVDARDLKSLDGNVVRVRSRRPHHHTINTKIMECRCMAECPNDPDRTMLHGTSFPLAARLKLAAMGFVALALGGCASASSSMFVNPAKYSLYNCEQLAKSASRDEYACRRA